MAPAAGGSAVGKYSFDPKAYAKLVMHCCKHSSSPCLGVLLGQAQGQTGSGKAGVRIMDAVPLFHTHSLAPMLKVAFMLIDQHCRKAGGELQIVGIYHAASHSAVELAPTAKPIGDKIAAQFSGASIWAFDASRLAQQQPALKGFSSAKDEWKPLPADAAGVSGDVLKHTARLITEMKYLELVDFDDHLADPAADWLNAALFQGDALSKLPCAE
eukprot:TRINITY_DN54106_c0_g1_i1.p1 TRINITY_DN54106_c0_g1~~TRINITY_DN54106_c0_g1_i1.p1  ORF type:complete len:214 (+),score=48.88 TRINITY_DN54106_c0_g1_i1:83-724(+)